jgi:hypothetical protein
MNTQGRGRTLPSAGLTWSWHYINLQRVLGMALKRRRPSGVVQERMLTQDAGLAAPFTGLSRSVLGPPLTAGWGMWQHLCNPVHGVSRGAA